MAAPELRESNGESRDAATPEIGARAAEAPRALASLPDPEKLDALAAVLERTASWFPAPAAPKPAPAAEGSVAPNSERDASAAPPPSRVRASSRPLGKKERRELERKQALLAAQRANEQRREKRRKRERLRTERLAARNQDRKPAAPPKIAAAKVAPRAALSEVANPAQPPQRGWRVPWVSLAILLFPLGAALRAARSGGEVHLGLVLISLPIAAVLAWFVRKL